MTPRIEEVGVHGVKLRVRRAGRGDGLVFLHGGAGVSDWLPFFDALAERFEIFVPDHPGFGASDDPEWIRSVRDVAMLYLELFEAIDLERVHLVGHSLGGWIAAEIAVRDCSRLASVTLIAPAGVRVAGVAPGDLFLWSPEQAVRNLYFDQRLAEEELARKPSPEELDVMLKNRFSFAKLAWQPRLLDPDLEKWLRRIKVPVQLVWGEADQVLPAAYAEAWQRNLPGARLERLAQCGHLPHVERAEAVASTVRTFIEGVRA